MWRPAFVRFGVLAVVAMSCWSGTPRETTISNRAASSERDLTGGYYCSIEEGGFRYPAYPCAIRKIEGRWRLAKLGGSQRFRGELEPRGDAFRFVGEFYCPWGDCTQPLHGELRPIGNGALRGTFSDHRMVVTFEPAPDSAFGGASYGGDGYGGFGYGGFGYGGFGYGGRGYGGATYGSPLQIRSNRWP